MRIRVRLSCASASLVAGRPGAADLVHSVSRALAAKDPEVLVIQDEAKMPGRRDGRFVGVERCVSASPRQVLVVLAPTARKARRRMPARSHPATPQRLNQSRTRVARIRYLDLNQRRNDTPKNRNDGAPGARTLLRGRSVLTRLSRVGRFDTMTAAGRSGRSVPAG